MAARSVRVTLSNTLQYEDAGLTGGIWSVFPPSPLTPFSQAISASESNGILTGTAGTASYHLTYTRAGGDVIQIDVPDLQHLALAWNNPYAGDNTYAQSVGKAGFEIHRTGGEGDNADVIFTLRHSSQSNWRWCNKCQCLAFAGSTSPGACAAGGLHNHQGSWNYVLIHNSPQARGQDNWRWCGASARGEARDVFIDQALAGVGLPVLYVRWQRQYDALALERQLRAALGLREPSAAPAQIEPLAETLWRSIPSAPMIACPPQAAPTVHKPCRLCGQCAAALRPNARFYSQCGVRFRLGR